MTPIELSRTVLRAVRCAVDEGELSVAVPERAVVTSPGPGGCGDYATNIALQLARPAGRAPRQVAEILRTHLRGAAGVSEVAITGPGFLNISLNREATQEVARTLVSEILQQGSQYGYGYGYGDEYGDSYGPDDTLAEQVIALRVPHDTRAEALADTLVRIIATQGGRAEVHHSEPNEPVDLRPVPAPEDPAPLGHDAARWALLHPAPHDRPRITADHLVQRESNPLFRVRYAYARTRALSRNAAALGFDSVPGDVSEAQDLLAPLAEYPRVLSAAATHRAPDRLARHLVTTADALLDFQHTVLPLGDEKPSAAHRARLALAEAAGTVLAGGLSLLGISAPEHL
ncbi:ArgS-related anticodon-binding protein NrtL [Streptomyces sp. NBC_00658]|uniref:ArgS-related anticodon-binding protein NrtL n=1 Tax=Streptomyces sp. NBC_00658 TaxID=2975800 RepID=UPI0032456A8B